MYIKKNKEPKPIILPPIKPQNHFYIKHGLFVVSVSI